MEPLVPFAFLGLALALVLWLSRRAVTVCVIDVRGGKLRVARGGIAPRLLADLGDVVARPPVREARLRITRSGGRAVLAIEGAVPEGQRQRLRNVVGSVPLAALGNTPRAPR